jgi:nucleoside-diphosphate-sugar epimerase
MRRRSVSITGATGFIGWQLAERFRDMGWDVRGLVRPGSTKALPPGIVRIEAALDPKALGALADGADVLVHGAALTRAPRASMFDAVNVEGTRAVVEAANRAGCRLLFVSSQAAAGTGRVSCPTREDDVPRPINAYGRSKLAAEGVVRTEARVPWTIARPSSVYGPRDRAFLPLFRLASRGISLMAAEPSTCVTLIYIDDLLDGLTLASTSDRSVGETIFLGHVEPSAVGDLMRQFAEACGRTYRPWHVPRIALRAAALAGELWWHAGRVPVLDRARLAELTAEGFVCSVTRARDLLGFNARVPLAEGLDRTVHWYREKGWL